MARVKASRRLIAAVSCFSLCCRRRSRSVIRSVFAPWSKLRSSTPDGGPLGPLSQSDLAGSTDTLGETDFIVLGPTVWTLRVAPECSNLNLHTPVGTTLAIAFIMFSPERLVSFQQAYSVMECCGLVEGPHEWSPTLSTTSRVPKPVYEALLGTLYADLVSKEGNDWKFGTGTRNVDQRTTLFSFPLLERCHPATQRPTTQRQSASKGHYCCR